MTLRDFLFAADALRMEEGVSFTVQTPTGPSVSVPSPADVREQNAQAMAALTGMMAGVKQR